jgi:hypothetical protein
MPRVGVGKQLADIRLAQRAQNGVGHSVVDGIAITVTDRPAGMFLKTNAAKDHHPAVANWGPRLKSMQVVSVADADWRSTGRH